MRNRMKMKTAICYACALLIGIAVFPFQGGNLTANAKTQESYVIFEADPDKVATKKDGDVTATVTSGVITNKTVKSYDSEGAYFSAGFSIEGKGGKSIQTIFKSDLDRGTAGFGWLGDKNFLTKVYSYFTVNVEYRVLSENAIPDDAKLTFGAAYESNSDACTFGSVSAADCTEWKKASFPVGNTFASVWSSGYITMYLSTQNGNFSGEQTVDIRRISISVEEKDRLNFNNALKLARFLNIENFTKDVDVPKDTNGKSDIFGMIIANDYLFYSSIAADPGYHLVHVTENSGVMVCLSSNRAKTGEVVDIHTAMSPKEQIKSIEVKTLDGTPVEVSRGAPNRRYSFVMPDDAVSISITKEPLEQIPMELLWYCEPGTQPYRPYYSGVNSWPYTLGKIHDMEEGTYVYSFSISETQGNAILYGRGNSTYLIEDFYDTAYITMRVKFTTETDNRVIKIGDKENGPVKEITVGEKWAEIGFYYKDITAITDFSYFTIDLTTLSVGDILYIGNVCIWSDKPESSFAAFEQIRDISHYDKKDTNIKMFEVGDTTAEINPWNNPGGQRACPIHFDRAWTTIFQNMYTWEIYDQTDIAEPQPYSLEFFDNAKATEEYFQDGGMRNYRDTGYIEFFVKATTDGLIIPFNVIADGGVTLPIHVKYEKAKAREDGFMRVRIPFTYLADFGMDLSKIVRTSIIGVNPLPESIFLSSFRFYTNYADNPDPPLIEEEDEFLDERDLPLELNGKILNAVLDKTKKTLYIPAGTHIWEVLSAITFDTEETYAWFYDGTKIVEDEDLELSDRYDMLLYRRDFYLTTFRIQYLTEEAEPADAASDDDSDFTDDRNSDDLSETSTDMIEENTDTAENSQTGQNKIVKKIKRRISVGDTEDFPIWIWILIAGAVVVVAAGTAFLIYFKKKKTRRNDNV